MRCRTYAAMIGLRKKIDIDELAAAIPTRYSKCVDDLQWMLGEGLLKGMYIDGTDRVLTYPDAEKQPEEPVRPAKTGANGVKIYPEEERIRALNDQITDDYVSARMDRLEELTHKILAYAEAHPEKDNSLRQFRNHYLPKTFSILESYARMERMGVEGGNISSAMKDVEDIMDKLVLGFEKQLDALFDSEAMDVTTDVSVLENMMTMEGLSDLDPFGSLKKDEELRKYSKKTPWNVVPRGFFSVIFRQVWLRAAPRREPRCACKIATGTAHRGRTGPRPCPPRWLPVPSRTG